MRTPTSPIRNSRLVLASIVACFALTTFVSAAPTFADGYDPAGDANSMYHMTRLMGARAWWAAGYTGKGVDVALIDTGVARVEGLNGLVPSGKPKVAYGPDLSFESQAPNLRSVDTDGHGTFMAGLIAANDDSAVGTSPGPSVYRGVAPDARVVSLKVGAYDGGVDVSQVIAAIDWVVKHRKDSGFNIRVISLSYGTTSVQAPGLDPLAYAVERAWKAGIVVVAAAGNRGYLRNAGVTCLADPAENPFVISVAGVDTNGTEDSSDDVIGGYSSTGAYGCKSPDVAAPGSHLQGLRVPSSYIDQTHSEGYLSDRYFRGTGTSQSTALVAGAAALVLQRYPRLVPDQVKKYLAIGADTLYGDSIYEQGAGEVDLTRLLAITPPTSNYRQMMTAATGAGTLEGARGDTHAQFNGVELRGERDIMNHAVNTTTLASLEAKGSAWSNGVFNYNTWSGSSWSGTTYASAVWTTTLWTGDTWASVTWSDNTWDGRSWTGLSWTSTDWSGRSWTSGDWTDDAWSSHSWQ